MSLSRLSRFSLLTLTTQDLVDGRGASAAQRSRSPFNVSALAAVGASLGASDWPSGDDDRVTRIYVTGHRNPDTDSIASAVGYAELKRRLDPRNDYVPVRLGELNAQTRWVLEHSGAPEPELLPHVLLRVCDVMRARFPLADHGEPVRRVGLIMARDEVDLVPVVDQDGTLAGVMSERALARRYVRESREASRLDAPTAVGAISGVLEGEQLVGEPDELVTGRVWVLAMASASLPLGFAAGDVVVVGNRPQAQRIAIDVGVGLLVITNGTTPDEAVLDLARQRGTAVVASPLDSYVTARMITLSAPCRSLMDREPLVVGPDDLVADVAETVKEVDYRAAVVVDADRRPVGLVTRSDLVNPQPRRVLLVDHAEQAQSVIGVEHAEIVEILDHHHIGSIETQVPVRATFDPVGSTATLVIERFRQSGMEPTRPAATLMLGAILSDTVILNSPTTTERDRAVIGYLEQVLALDATAFGREMFERTSDVARVPAEEILRRDVKDYDAGGGQTLRIAQVETVGQTLHERRDELLRALDAVREREGQSVVALMVTDIMSKGTQLYASGDASALERAFGDADRGGVVNLPGVMSRKKQVAPKLLAALSGSAVR
jgi:manganese-dependent inorganic pyrophosphatase